MSYLPSDFREGKPWAKRLMPLTGRIPRAVVAAEAELLARYEFDSLEKWLYSSEAHSLPLRGVEVAEQRRGRELLRLLLQAHVESRGDGDVGAAIRVHEPDSPDGHLIYTHKHEHTRHLITIFGEIRVKRIDGVAHAVAEKVET